MLQQLDIAIAFVVLMLMLSLLVTAIVQATSALLDLRGKNLVRSLADLLNQIDTGLRAVPGSVGLMKKIRNFLTHPFSRITFATLAADAVATHPTLAHTFARAKAIRKDELLDVLKDLCSDAPAGKIDPAVQSKLKEILATQVPGAAETVESAQALADALATKFPGIKDDVKNAVFETVGKVSRLEAGVEKWFDTVMDRASDIFTRWTRVITVVISILLVVVLHIDSGLILHQISSNPEIRAGLTKISDTALSQADETLKSGDRATAALKAVAEKHKGDAIEGDLNGAPPLVNCADGKKWLEDYAKKTNKDMNQVQSEFADSCQQQTVAALGKSEDQIGKIRQELAETELKIVPDRVEGQLVFGSTNDSAWSRIKSWAKAYTSTRHLLGTLAMVILLSLGAPFWYNVLSQLSNLRPNISTKIGKESSES
jgi:hypothetical protein